MSDQAPSTTLSFDHAWDERNEKRLASCRHHIFNASPMLDGDAQCTQCGGIVPILLAHWYNYGFGQAIDIATSTLKDVRRTYERTHHE